MASDSDSDAYMQDADSDFGDDDVIETENIEPLNKAGGKAATAQPIKSPKNAVAPTADSKKKKTVEEIYQKKTQLEHILLRPDTYSEYKSPQRLHDQYNII